MPPPRAAPALSPPLGLLTLGLLLAAPLLAPPLATAQERSGPVGLRRIQDVTPLKDRRESVGAEKLVEGAASAVPRHGRGLRRRSQCLDHPGEELVLGARAIRPELRPLPRFVELRLEQCLRYGREPGSRAHRASSEGGLHQVAATRRTRTRALFHAADASVELDAVVQADVEVQLAKFWGQEAREGPEVRADDGKGAGAHGEAGRVERRYVDRPPDPGAVRRPDIGHPTGEGRELVLSGRLQASGEEDDQGLQALVVRRVLGLRRGADAGHEAPVLVRVDVDQGALRPTPRGRKRPPVEVGRERYGVVVEEPAVGKERLAPGGAVDHVHTVGGQAGMEGLRVREGLPVLEEHGGEGDRVGAGTLHEAEHLIHSIALIRIGGTGEINYAFRLPGGKTKGSDTF